jgi:hypothetical protein
VVTKYSSYVKEIRMMQGTQIVLQGCVMGGLGKVVKFILIISCEVYNFVLPVSVEGCLTESKHSASRMSRANWAIWVEA